MSAGDIAAIVSAAIAVASAVVAGFAVYLPWVHQHDSQLFQQAILSLERAYRSLSNDGNSIKPPLADRLNWLTTARHLEGYKAVKVKVKSKLYRALCEEHEEYWRHQFYLCLDMHNIHQSSYYDEGPPPERKPGIEPRSALIIYSFASWPNGKSDPIDSVDIPALLKESDPLKGNIGLSMYLDKFPRLLRET